jgi:TonB-linked SusC/RagA family outer membrane protein
MACCVLLLCLATATVFAKPAQEHKFSLRAKNIAISSVFSEIRKQTGLHVFYNNDLLNDKERVNVQFAEVSVEKVLRSLLQGRNLQFNITDNYVVIFAAKDKSFEGKNMVSYFTHPEGLYADTVKPKRISGKVEGEEEGQPLSGAAIVVQRTKKGTTTDAKGEFVIDVQPGDSIAVSYVGKNTEVIVYRSQPALSFILKNGAGAALTDVVITGYQTIDRKLFTGSAVKLKAEDVKMDGVIDVSRMLEGRAAGVSIQNVSGTFGSAPKVRIRGATSITGDNKPLWVVDGIVLEDIVNISNDQLSSGDPSTLLGSAVAGINADDIQSFEILKDASAAALYGARAMNGVIVITTKKGKAGKPVVSYNGNFTTFLKPSYSTFNIMNSNDQMSVYSEMQRKGWMNFSDAVNADNGGVFTKMYNQIKAYEEGKDGFVLENSPEARAKFLERYAKANTDWFDVLFRNSLTQEHSLSLSSGTDAAQYYFSTSYYKDNGWTIGDNVKRYTANLRSNYKFNNWLSGGLITTASIRDQRAPGTMGRSSNVVEGRYTRDFDINPFSYALNTSRTITPYNQDGTLEYFTRNFAPFNIINELANNYIDLNMMDVKIQGELGFKLSKNLEYRVLGAIRYVKTTRETKIKENSNMPMAYRANYNSIVNDANRFLYTDIDNPDNEKVVVLPQGGFYNRDEDMLKNYYIRNTLAWKKDFDHTHMVSVLVGQESKYTDRQSSANTGFGYMWDKGGVAFSDYRYLKQMLEGNYNYFNMNMYYDRFASFFGNAQYAFESKYVFSGTVRYDGSNRLGNSPRARWLPTWTLSGAWNIDQEKFMQHANYIDYLKLRGTYGLNASMGSASNSSVVYRNSSTLRPNLIDVEPQIVIDGLENAELTWEKQYETNIGVDLGLWKGKVNLTVEGYKRRGFDLISLVRTTGIGGQSSKQANNSDMVSHGVEVTLGTKLLDKNNWVYRTNLTFGYNKSRITNLKSKPRIYDLVIPEGGAKEGGAVRGLYSIDFKGLDPFTGVPTFIDESGVHAFNVYVQSTNTDYLKYEGPVDPAITGGFNNTVSYKNITVNVFFSYQVGNKIRLNNAYKSYYSDLDAMPKEFLDRWTVPGDEARTDVPSILYHVNQSNLGSVYPYTNYNYSSVRVADGSFVRLKSISLQYAAPSKWVKSIGAKNISFNLVATNIWLMYSDSKLKGQDPEFFASGGVALPMPRQFTLSAKIGF